MVRRGDVLDIEEFFVWPLHRCKGFGRKLAELVKEIANRANLKLRALVSYADIEPDNRPALLRLMVLLGLYLHPSTLKSVAFFGLEIEYAGELVDPIVPIRPASMRDALNPENTTRQYTVWYGTNRTPVDIKDVSEGYTGQRDNRIHYGICNVSIPRTHRFGSTGASWWKRWLRLSSDEPLRIVCRLSRDKDEFWTELNSEMNKYPEERQALIFLHGYKNTFDGAALRAAQIGFDLRISGITALFSWASAGATLDYQTDEASIEASELAIADFLNDFVKRSGAERIHLIAHSMGNRGFLRAIQRIVANVPTPHRIRFGQIILAAPDIDADVFRDLAKDLPDLSERTTLYISPHDRAIGLSKWLHSYPRAGLTPPVTIVPGIDTIEVPCLDLTDSTWHSYFAEATSLLHDIFTLVNFNLPPDRRQRLSSKLSESGQQYWEVLQ